MTDSGAPGGCDAGARKNPGRHAVVWSAGLVALAAVCALTVFFGKRYVAGHWGGGNFPPLIGHLFVILLGGVMVAGLVASAVGSILAAWALAKWSRGGHDRTPLVVALITLVAGIAVFVYLNP